MIHSISQFFTGSFVVHFGDHLRYCKYVRTRTKFMSFFALFYLLFRSFLQNYHKNWQTNCTHSIFRTIEAPAVPSSTNFKNDNNIKRFVKKEFLIKRDCSVRSNCHYVVCRVIMGFEQKRSKNNILIQFAKSPVRQATSQFCQAPSCSASC